MFELDNWHHYSYATDHYKEEEVSFILYCVFIFFVGVVGLSAMYALDGLVTALGGF